MESQLERANLLALLYVMFLSISHLVWYVIVSIPDLCLLTLITMLQEYNNT